MTVPGEGMTDDEVIAFAEQISADVIPGYKITDYLARSSILAAYHHENKDLFRKITEQPEFAAMMISSLKTVDDYLGDEEKEFDETIEKYIGSKLATEIWEYCSARVQHLVELLEQSNDTDRKLLFMVVDSFVVGFNTANLLRDKKDAEGA